MRALVPGGDGFCGWPNALHLSVAGHESVLLDYNPRHGAMRELGLAPHLLDDESLGTMLRLAIAHRDRIRSETIAPRITWHAGAGPHKQPSTAPAG